MEPYCVSFDSLFNKTRKSHYNNPRFKQLSEGYKHSWLSTVSVVLFFRSLKSTIIEDNLKSHPFSLRYRLTRLAAALWGVAGSIPTWNKYLYGRQVAVSDVAASYI